MARLAAALFCVLAIGAEASARTELLQWTHADPSTVTGFRVNWRSSGGNSSANAGLPSRDTQGRYSFTANVPDSVDVYFTVTAYNATGDSPASNEICRGPGVPCGSGTGGGGGGTGGTTAQSSINGFRLWDANTDTVLDTGFVSGEVITNGCAAIEIVGNSYLSSGSGSLMKQHCAGSGCTPQPASCQAGSYENTSPFGWEDDAGVGRFNCAASLQVAGPHTLKVTPFDGKDCTGTAGTPLSIDFSVNLTQTPTVEPLGVPGQPQLVTE